MTQISRPFQIALVALGLFIAVWFVALRGHSPSSTGSSGSSAPASSSAPSSAAAQAKSAAAPTSEYHGAAPGVAGLTRAVNKAHGAVAQSQSDAKRVEHGESSGSTPAGTSTVTVKRSVSRTAGHTTTRVTHTTTVTHSSPGTTKSAAAAPVMQKAVERELRQHKTVLILFWNHHGADDVAVHQEIPAVQHALGGKVAVHYASAGQVGSFGTVTHAVQVNQTPTLLIVGRGGQTTTITGLTDAFSIKQIVADSRHS
jgi:hypothetical protein